jgi:hypothetical protein
MSGFFSVLSMFIQYFCNEKERDCVELKVKIETKFICVGLILSDVCSFLSGLE